MEGDPGIDPVYDWTTWKEGMAYPGSTQLGIGKKLLEQYPWSRFEPHPEWADKDCFAAGLPGKVRLIYQPKRGIYDWNGSRVKKLDREVAYRVFYFDPATGRRFDKGTVIYAGLTPSPFAGHRKPLLFEDTLDNADAASWKDYGTPFVKVGNTTAGKNGLWLFQIGERQEFGRFAVSASPFDPPKGPVEARLPDVIRTDEYHAPDLPSPQDWVLVLERLKP